ncbi:hypothetical protein BJX70DRAFT_400239 [Aspergillus crustosus]
MSTPERPAADLQYATSDTPLAEIVKILERDGAVIVRNLISYEDLVTVYDDIKDVLDADPEWEGDFFASMATTPSTPQNPAHTVQASLNKGDALILFASCFHGGGGGNTTPSQRRLVYSTFAIRGHLRQEENQYLAVPREMLRGYDRATQDFLGYYIRDPACEWVEHLDPFYVLWPERVGEARLKDF